MFCPILNPGSLIVLTLHSIEREKEREIRTTGCPETRVSENKSIPKQEYFKTTRCSRILETCPLIKKIM